MPRTLFKPFQTANPIYINASVAFYTVDGNGAKTSTLATLYDAETGSGTLSNPQTLDSEGKLAQAVYYAEPVIATVTTLTAGSHDTGIQRVLPLVQAWVTGTIFLQGQLIYDGDSASATYLNIYEVAATYTSDSTIAADISNSDLTLRYPGRAVIEWATRAEDSLIPTAYGGDGATDYSALHHAAKAAASATSASAALASIPAFSYAYSDTTTMADPGAGIVRFNNATLSSATAMAIDATTAEAGNPDISDFIATWDDVSNAVARGYITMVKDGAAGTFAIFSVTGAVTDNTGWLQVTVTYVSGAGAFSDADSVYISFGYSGADGSGDMTGPGSSADNTFPRFDGAGGDTLQSGQTTEDDSGNVVIAGSVTAEGGDVNGNEFILDADGDTSLTADTDDQIDVKVGGSDIMRFIATGLNMLGNMLIGFAEKQTSAASSSGTLTLNYLDGPHFHVTLTENITTISFTNWPSSGNLGQITVEWTQDPSSAYAVTHTGVDFGDAGAPDLSTLSSVTKCVYWGRTGSAPSYGATGFQKTS